MMEKSGGMLGFTKVRTHHFFSVVNNNARISLVDPQADSYYSHFFTKQPQDIAKYATTSRSGQACAFAVGCFVFFDDYANVLLAGETMRPLLDSLCVSREKLAFIVDATAAPVASISPVSSWVGFEIGLIEEVARIIEQEGTDDLRIKTSGMAIFLQSIKYRYVRFSLTMIFL